MDKEVDPKDPMQSTWRVNRDKWTIFHWLYELTNIYPVSLGQPVPFHSKKDRVPYAADWQPIRWVLVHAFIPLALHQAYVSYMGTCLHPIIACIFYSVSFKLIAIHELHMLRQLGHTYGFFDGDVHKRDCVPDLGVRKVLIALILTSACRPLFSIILSYQPSRPPISMSWSWLPLEIGLYGISIDFWYYWYHRAMPETRLWRYHRTHHLTKHPNPLLTLYADTVQEIMDIAAIPILTFFFAVGLPMSFYEWWICHQHIVYSELAGHSGIRTHVSTPSTINWLLRLCDAELVIEDHDLHHRNGWMKSHNYGKQTRLWDQTFGTYHGRIEGTDDNIDYYNPVTIPLL